MTLFSLIISNTPKRNQLLQIWHLIDCHEHLHITSPHWAANPELHLDAGTENNNSFQNYISAGAIKECQGSILCFLAPNESRKTEAEGRERLAQHSLPLANFCFPFPFSILLLWALPTERNRIRLRWKQKGEKEIVEEARVLVMQQQKSWQ